MAPDETPRIELVRGWRGRLELLGEHVGRLLSGARDEGAAAAIETEACDRFERSGRRDGIVTLTLDATSDGARATAAAARDPDYTGERLAEGLALLHAGTRPPLPSVKDVGRCELARALLAQARSHGADELLWSSEQGALLGATTMNLFLIRGATLSTPTIESGAWPGLLRRAVLIAARQLAAELGLDVREERLNLDHLARADDAFLAGSAHGIVALRSIDGRPLLAPPRGSPARAVVPKLKLRVHELCSARFLPAE